MTGAPSARPRILVALPGQGEVGLHAEHLGLGHPDPPVVGLAGDSEGVGGAGAGDVPGRRGHGLRRMGTPHGEEGGEEDSGTNAHRRLQDEQRSEV